MKKIRDWFKKLPERKPHLDFIIAILTVIVLITVIIANIGSLTGKNKPASTPTPLPQKINIQLPSSQVIQKEGNTNPTAKECKKEVGPISIESPQENQIMKDNPVCFTIKYDDPNYCSVVWSYRINGAAWSDLNNNSVCLYNVPSGDVHFELRVQSTASQDQTTLKRNFVYAGQAAPTTAESSSSAR